MKNEHLDHLIKKYLNGESTLAEEEVLFDKSDKVEDPLDGWSAYVQHKRTKAPIDMVDQIAATTHLRERQRPGRIIMLSAIAACIIILGLVAYNTAFSTKMSDAEKRIKLDEALAMFEQSQQDISPQQILYEDEMIVIYIDP